MKEYKVVVETITKAQERWADSYIIESEKIRRDIYDSLNELGIEWNLSKGNFKRFGDHYDLIRVSIQMTDKSQNVENIIIHQEIIER